MKKKIADVDPPSFEDSGQPVTDSVGGESSSSSEASEIVANLIGNRNIQKKRDDYLEWSEYFMGLAFLSAMRSKDPVSQVGACIVNNENKVVGVGYNGMPIGCSDDVLPWNKLGTDRLQTKYMYVCHAEMNAVLNKISADVKGCTIYVALFPCNECAKIIIQAGIRGVVYMSDKHASKDETKAAKLMFDMAGVSYRQFIPRQKKIVIDFEAIDWNHPNQIAPVTVDEVTSTEDLKSLKI